MEKRLLILLLISCSLSAAIATSASAASSSASVSSSASSSVEEEGEEEKGDNDDAEITKVQTFIIETISRNGTHRLGTIDTAAEEADIRAAENEAIATVLKQDAQQRQEKEALKSEQQKKQQQQRAALTHHHNVIAIGPSGSGEKKRVDNRVFVKSTRGNVKSFERIPFRSEEQKRKVEEGKAERRKTLKIGKEAKEVVEKIVQRFESKSKDQSSALSARSDASSDSNELMNKIVKGIIAPGSNENVQESVSEEVRFVGGDHHDHDDDHHHDHDKSKSETHEVHGGHGTKAVAATRRVVKSSVEQHPDRLEIKIHDKKQRLVSVNEPHTHGADEGRRRPQFIIAESRSVEHAPSPFPKKKEEGTRGSDEKANAKKDLDAKIAIKITDESASSEKEKEEEEKEKEKQKTVDWRFNWPWYKKCQSTRHAVAIYVQNDVLVNADPYYQHSKPLADSCPKCSTGSQYSYKHYDFEPSGFSAGSLVSLDLNCSTIGALCVETLDGTRYRGFADHPDVSSLYLTVWSQCERGAPACEPKVVLDIDDAAWALGPETASQAGLQEVDGPSRIVVSSQYDPHSGHYKSRNAYRYLSVRGVACNSCNLPLSYCDFARPPGVKARRGENGQLMEDRSEFTSVERRLRDRDDVKKESGHRRKTHRGHHKI